MVAARCLFRAFEAKFDLSSRSDVTQRILGAGMAYTSAIAHARLLVYVVRACGFD
jgi:hypothetical protein